MNGAGERSSQAQNAVSGRPACAISCSMRAKALRQRHRLVKAHAARSRSPARPRRRPNTGTPPECSDIRRPRKPPSCHLPIACQCSRPTLRISGPLTRPRRAPHTCENNKNADRPLREDIHEASQSRRLGFGALVVGGASRRAAQAADIKIGVIYDYTGPFAGGGSKAAAIGNKIAIDMINEKGGVEGHKIVGDLRRRQSKTDVAINEAERLLNEQKVDLHHGRLLERALRADGRQGRRGEEVHVDRTSASPPRCSRTRICNTCSARRCIPTSSARPRARSSPRTPRRSSARSSRTSRSRSSTRTAPTASASRTGNEAKCKELGMQIVHKEAYSATATDLSALVTKLRRAQPDVILHTGYNPDITLFLRQAKEAGLKFTALIGHGAGYGQIDKLMRDLRHGRELLLQRRSGGGAAARPEDAEARRRRPDRRDGQALQGRDRRAAKCRRTSRWASTTPGSSSPTCCRARSRSTAASIPRRCARRRSRPTFRRAARSRATA